MSVIENGRVLPSGEVCPFTRYEDVNIAESAPGEHQAIHDRMREGARVYYGVAGAESNPFWQFTEMEDIRAAYQNATVFANESVQPTMPNPPFKWIPEMLDGQIHTRWRQLLSPLFAPAAIDRLRPKVIQRFDDIMNEIVAKGECDYVADVALRFPNEIFMELFGMPTSDAEQFQVWETAILHGAGSASDSALQAMMSVNGYFAELIALKRRQPGEDIISYALTWEIDGEKISDEDLLAFCLLMFMAGLDTVAMQLSYSMYHLAINPDDRAKILADPDRVWPLAVEEFLRYYAFVTPGRKIMADTDFNGCPMKKGEMLWLPICSANRDPKAFDNADRVIVDREVNPHIAFGAGPHRWVGSYLARQELLIGLRGWHERIPNYRLAPGVKVIEHGGQMGLTNLPLIWDKK